MKKSAMFISFAAVLCTAPAFAQDAGTADAGTPAGDAGVSPEADAGTPAADAGVSPEADAGAADPCGGLTLQGECVGTQLRYCQEGEIFEVECDTLNGNAPAGTATCGEIDAEWGYDCKLADGEACQGENFVAFCEDGSGCTVDLDAQTATCTEVGTCTPAENFAPVCDGDRLTLDCNRGQPYGLVCPTGSSCTAGACAGVQEGGACDGDVLLCADDLTCSGGLCTAATNEPAPAPEGEPEGEPSAEPAAEPEGEPEAAAGCNASHVPASGVPASMALLALLGMAIRRRR